jgi:hypothetical protein
MSGTSIAQRGAPGQAARAASFTCPLVAAVAEMQRLLRANPHELLRCLLLSSGSRNSFEGQSGREPNPEAHSNLGSVIPGVTTWAIVSPVSSLPSSNCG